MKVEIARARLVVESELIGRAGNVVARGGDFVAIAGGGDLAGRLRIADVLRGETVGVRRVRRE